MKKTQLFLYPMTVVFIIYIVSLAVGLNFSKYLCDFYHYRAFWFWSLRRTWELGFDCFDIFWRCYVLVYGTFKWLYTKSHLVSVFYTCKDHYATAMVEFVHVCLSWREITLTCYELFVCTAKLLWNVTDGTFYLLLNSARFNRIVVELMFVNTVATRTLFRPNIHVLLEIKR